MGHGGVTTNDDIFGGTEVWHCDDWIDSDDRVRGGCSKSYLAIDGNQAVFHGNLDIEKLGGAGFASQRTTREDRHWDLSRYSAIELLLELPETDDKIYTFILKDQLLPAAVDGREQSTVSWEFDFGKKDAESDREDATFGNVVIPWSAFTPTYRGRQKKDAAPLQKFDVKRMSLMMRSFFGSQHGTFRLAIVAIRGIPESDPEESAEAAADENTSSVCSLDKAVEDATWQSRPSRWSRLFCLPRKL